MSIGYVINLKYVSFTFRLASSKPDCQQKLANGNRGPDYVSLMRAVYTLANRSSTLPVITSCLLRILFMNLKTDALIFLAGVWTSSISPTSDDNSALQEVALRHAAAFLEAHVLEGEGADFQTILPALLVGLQNQISGVRKAAIECLNRIRLISEKKLKSVYKFDEVYGDVKGVFAFMKCRWPLY